MHQIIKSLQSNVDKIILFVGGVIVSAIISALLEELITWSSAIVNISIMFVIILAVYSLDFTRKSAIRLVNETETTWEYTSEPDSMSKFSGNIYRRLFELVEQSETEILYLSGGANNIINLAVYEHPSRIKFFESDRTGSNKK